MSEANTPTLMFRATFSSRAWGFRGKRLFVGIAAKSLNLIRKQGQRLAPSTIDIAITMKRSFMHKYVGSTNTRQGTVKVGLRRTLNLNLRLLHGNISRQAIRTGYLGTNNNTEYRDSLPWLGSIHKSLNPHTIPFQILVAITKLPWCST